jgi:type IV pilus assembly protein PilQ
LRTESFQLNYAKADAFSKILTDDKQRILSKRGSAVWDPRTNQLFIQDVSSRLEEVRKLVAKVDIPVRQVLIEARIVEASDTFSKNLGVRLGTGDLAFLNGTALRPGSPIAGNSGLRAGLTGNYLGVGEQVGQAAVTGTSYIPNTQNVSMPAQGINGINAGSLAVSLFTNSLSRFINLEISALEAEGKGKIISAPRVLTADQIEATIEQGTELPYQQATSSGATSVTFRKANLSLKVKPQITPEGNIIMDVQVNKDSVGQITTAGFAIDTKNVKTQVLVDNGGTVVIGGIYTQNERDSLTKVPFFGDLPVFGNLFRNTQRQNDKTELLVFITPRVVSDRLTVR